MNFYLATALLLGSASQRALGQPINSEDDYEMTGHFFEVSPTSRTGQSSFCYNGVLAGILGTPKTEQYLAMFTDKFVEHKGRVFTVKNDSGTGGYDYGYNTWPYDEEPNGLYEVTTLGHHNCVTFKLLFKNDNIGQIVASSQFDTGNGANWDAPDLIIGVDQETNRIWGYYEDGGVWRRQITVWGDALDGSLSVEPIDDYSKKSAVSGLSLNGRLFSLYGKFPGNFNYAKQNDVHCASKPAIIDDWSGTRAGSRGKYCPGDDNKLWKYTWHSSSSQTDKLGWKSASKITRLGPRSNIFGISPSGELVTLWDQKGVAVHCTTINGLPSIQGVKAVGGLDDGYARGVFVSNWKDKVYNVFWDNGWKEAEIGINYRGGFKVSLYFGNHEGKTYLLHIWQQDCLAIEGVNSHCDFGKADPYYYELDLYRLDFVGGLDRYKAELLASGRQDPI